MRTKNNNHKNSNLSNKPSEQLNLSYKKFLLILGISFVLSISFITWYQNQDTQTQEKAQSIILDYIIDPIRNNNETPESLALAFDYIADFFPVMQKPMVNTTLNHYSPYKLYIYGGIPSASAQYNFLKNEAYLVGYDESNHNPAWVAFRLFENDIEAISPRPDRFQSDSRTLSKVSPDDYKNTGYDRGHMAPNYAIARCYGKNAQIETFLMSNIVPQLPKLNREIWKFLEHREIKRMAQRLGEIWIITGPIYYNDSESYLPSKIRIPDAFYNIVIDEIEGKGLRALAFIIPQKATGKNSLTQYLTSIDHIEYHTGINFFSDLPHDVQNQLEAAISPRIW